MPIDILTPEIQTNAQYQFELNDTHKDLIQSIKLTELDLTVRSPQDGDFSFLNSVKLYLSADDLPEVLVAWKTDIPDNIGPHLVLDRTHSDLQSYVKKEAFVLRIELVTDEVLTNAMEVKAHAQFFVDAKILGL